MWIETISTNASSRLLDLQMTTDKQKTDIIIVKAPLLLRRTEA